MSQQGAAWYVTARTGVHLREYDLNEVRPDVPSTAELRDSDHVGRRRAGVRARREGIRRHRHLQTLEPRAFYVYVPYRNQSKAPIFDTAIDDFNFAQLFSVNRYLGNDRIGDANQLSLALTSRLLDAETGAERMRVAVGERFYFSDQRVMLNETPRSAQQLRLPGGHRGPAVRRLGAGRPAGNTTSKRRQTERFNAGRPLRARARPHAQRGLPLFAPELRSARRADRRPVAAQSMGHLRRNGRSTRTGRCSGAGTTRSSDSKTLEAVAGVEYNAGCWVLRLVGQRLTTTTQTAVEFGVLADRAERPRAVRHQPARPPAPQRPGLSQDQRSDGVAARPQRRLLPGILDRRESSSDRMTLPDFFAASPRLSHRRRCRRRARAGPDRRRAAQPRGTAPRGAPAGAPRRPSSRDRSVVRSTA